MKNIYRLLAVLIICAGCLPFVSCGDAVEIETRDFVVALGIDASDKPGENITVTVSTPGFEGGGSGAGNMKQIIKSGAGETLTAALRSADAYSSKKLYYGHTLAVIFGEKLLSDETKFKEVLDALERNADMNSRMTALAANGPVSDVLSSEPSGGALPLVGMYISNFYKNKTDAMSVTISQNLEGLIQSLKATGNALLPEISAVESAGSGTGDAAKTKEPKISGAGVIKNYEFAGWLDDKQTRGLLWLKGEGGGAKVSAELYGTPAALAVGTSSASIKFSENDEKNGVKCLITVNASGSAAEFNFAADYDSESGLTRGEAFMTLENKFEDIIADDIFAFADRVFGGMKVDALGFSEVLRKKYPSLYKKYGGGDWNETFGKVEIELLVNVNIRNTGMIN